MIEPDFRIVDEMGESLIAAMDNPDPAVNEACAVAHLRIGLRVAVHFLGREVAGEVLRKEALDVGIATGSAPPQTPVPEKPRNQRGEDLAESLIATGPFWAFCVGVGAIGIILARALP